MLEGLTSEQLAMPTLCDGWTPHLLAAHLVTFIDIPLPKFMFNVAMARGDFDAASVKMAAKIGERPTSDLIATLREKAAQRAKMPGFPPEITVADAVVHQQDVRRALNLDGQPDPELVRTGLDFITASKKAKLLVEQKGLLDGLRLEATDLDWSFGDGALVSGSAEAILLGCLRRPTLDELTGDGVEVLRGRLAAA